MATHDTMHAVLIAHGYFAQDTSDEGWELYDREEGPDGDEWVQTLGNVWQHRKDPSQRGGGNVLGFGEGPDSLDDYLRIKCN